MKQLLGVFLAVMLYLSTSPSYAAFPPVPPGVKPILVEYLVDVAYFYIWMQDGALYLRVKPVTEDVFVCSLSFSVMQDKEEHYVELDYGPDNSFCDNVSQATTFHVNGGFNATRTLALVFYDYAWDIEPTGHAGPIISAVKTTKGSTKVSIQLNPGTIHGYQADWWLYLKRGDSYYSYIQGSWKKGSSPIPFFQGRLCEFSMNELSIPFTHPSGKYELHFGVDRNMDGILSPETLDQTTRTIRTK